MTTIAETGWERLSGTHMRWTSPEAAWGRSVLDLHAVAKTTGEIALRLTAADVEPGVDLAGRDLLEDEPLEFGCDRVTLDLPSDAVKVLHAITSHIINTQPKEGNERWGPTRRSPLLSDKKPRFFVAEPPRTGVLPSAVS